MKKVNRVNRKISSNNSNEKVNNQKFFTTDDDFEKIIKSYYKNPTEISQVKTGWTNFVFKINNGKNTYFFRFPRNDFFSDALVKEYNFSKFINGKISFRVAKLRLKFNSGRPFTIHRGIVGESLSDCYNNLSEKEKNKLAKDIIKLISEFKEIDYSKFPDTDFQKVSNFLDNLSNVSQNGYDLSEHDFLKHLEDNNLTISHGDLNPGNLILKNHKLVAVIDFAFAGISSDLVDISRIVGRTPEEFKTKIAKAYKEKFQTEIDLKSIENLEKTWAYVEEKYILYIKQNHPTIVLPTLV